MVWGSSTTVAYNMGANTNNIYVAVTATIPYNISRNIHNVILVQMVCYGFYCGLPNMQLYAAV